MPVLPGSIVDTFHIYYLCICTEVYGRGETIKDWRDGQDELELKDYKILELKQRGLLKGVVYL